MLSEKCIFSLNKAIKQATDDGTTLIVLAVNPDSDQTALISTLPEGRARTILKQFVKETEEKVEVLN